LIAAGDAVENVTGLICFSVSRTAFAKRQHYCILF
jgi:hypothetical protein